MSHTLNIINALLAYQDAVATNNPQLRDFDYTRNLPSLVVENPTSGSRTLAPGESLNLFNGSVPTDMDGSSLVTVALLSGQDSRYRLSVAGDAGFRTARAVTGIDEVDVALNNNAVATFDFSGATLTGVVVGDLMRISGAMQYDAGPFIFNPLNSGLWKVIGVSGTVVSAVRPNNEAFSAAAESVEDAGTDVEFFSAAGIQIGDKFDVTGTLSEATRRTYAVADVTADTIDFVSSTPIPEESSLTYIPGTITFYNNSKRLLYVEVDQEATIRLNGDTSDYNRIVPIAAGDPKQIGYFHKWGDTFSATVVNKSVNPLRLQYLTAE